MLCSKCSETLKPVVAIDIDGTLGDYHTHFINFLRSYMTGLLDNPWYDRHGYGYDGSQPFSEWCGTMYGVDLATYRAVKLAYRQGGLKRSMPPYPAIGDITQVVQRMGAELWVTTTRPYLRLDGIDPDTRFWLQQNYIKFDGLLYDEDKYKVLAERIDPTRIVAVLDDLPEQVEQAELLFGPRAVIHRQTKYNRGYVRSPSVSTLAAASFMIQNNIRTWRFSNG